MATDEERLQILKMIEGGQITAEEGAKLLEALEEPSRAEARREGAPRWFRVRVTDLNTGKHKVNINLPFKLLDVGAKVGAKFARQLSCLQDVLALLQVLGNLPQPASSAGLLGRTVAVQKAFRRYENVCFVRRVSPDDLLQSLPVLLHGELPGHDFDEGHPHRLASAPAFRAPGDSLRFSGARSGRHVINPLTVSGVGPGRSRV